MPPADAGPAARSARAANRACYGDPETVGGYLGTPYHAIRRELAVDAFSALLDTAPPGPVLEVGSATDSMLGSLYTTRRLVAADLALEPLRSGKGDRICF